MMKKCSFAIALLLVFSLLMPLATTSARAEEIGPLPTDTIVSETTEYFEDGTSLTTVITERIVAQPQAASNIVKKEGMKTVYARNKDKEVLFSLMVHGYYTINMGVSATCTLSGCMAKVVDTAWTKESDVPTYTANKAIAEAKFVRKVLFVTLETRVLKVTLTCDKNGVLS